VEVLKIMDQQLKPLEDKLAEEFKGVPPLKKKKKKMLVQWWPYVTIVAGILQLFAALALYNWGKDINKLADSVNKFSSAFGVANTVEKLNIFYWISLAILVATGVIFLMAYPALQAKKRSGWSLMFLATILNAVYGVFSALNDRGGVSSLIGSLLGTAIGLYFLFQVRDMFGGAHKAHTEHKAPKSPTDS